MQKLKIKLENCHGIKKLEDELDFSESNVVAIYAQNGTMKTSFAKTFQDIINGDKTNDDIYPERVSIRSIKDETDTELSPDKIFVIESYNEKYKSDNVSTLLVDEKLKKQYEEIYKIINGKKNDLLKDIAKLSEVKAKELENLINEDFGNRNNFFKSINEIKESINSSKNKNFKHIVYSKLFNEKTKDLLLDSELLEKIAKYIDTYNNLLEKSKFFKKGVFSHNNASEVAKKLNYSGWFKADHSVNICFNGKDVKITNVNDLEKAITEEKNKILTDQNLIRDFEEIDKILKRNVSLIEFREHIVANKEIIIPELVDCNTFKKKLWIYYFSQNSEKYFELVDLFTQSKEQISEIKRNAEKQQTQWEKIINEFNNRYYVPFKVEISNKSDAILGKELPSIKFTFKDEIDKNIDDDLLFKVLSQGEKRALYILNILFEVEFRKNIKQKTLFIIDDIADSFDYKNKYAIIEYLKDMKNINYFYLIILSHNFDFYRNVSSRLSIPKHLKHKKYLIYAIKSMDRISLEEEKYQNNPFKTWKNFNNPYYEIACIPFVRNLAEFIGDEKIFLSLTGLLHQKEETKTMRMSDLFDLYKNILKNISGASCFPSVLVEDKIYQLADAICNSNQIEVELEYKVMLSMAIRLKAEKFMINKINDDEFVKNIKENQTYELFKLYKEKFSSEDVTLKILDRVNLMTPENIHINSFMYEPILDMSIDHLKDLYKSISDLI